MSVSLARRILAHGVVPRDLLHRALFESLRRATPLLQTLVEARPDLGRALDQLVRSGQHQAPEGWVPDRGLMSELPPGMCERLLAFPIREAADGEVEVVAADAADPHVTREFVAHLGRTVIVFAAPLAQVLAAAGVRTYERSSERALVRVAAHPSQSERPIPLVRKSSGQPRPRVSTSPGLGTNESTDGVYDASGPSSAPPSGRGIASVPVRSAVPPSPRGSGTRVATSEPSHVDAPQANRVPTERGLRQAPDLHHESRVGKETVPEAPVPLTKSRAPAPPDANEPPAAAADSSAPASPAAQPTPEPSVEKAQPEAVRPSIPRAPLAPSTLEATVHEPGQPPEEKPVVERAPRASRAPLQAVKAFVPKVPLARKTPPPTVSSTRREIPRMRIEEVEVRLAAAENPDEIARALALGGGPAALVFGVRPDQFVLRALGAEESRPELTLPRDAASVMRVTAEQDEYYGPLFGAPAHEPLFAWIEPGTVVFGVAVKVRGRAALVLLVPTGVDEEEMRRLGRRLSQAAARALEELIVRRKRTSP